MKKNKGLIILDCDGVLTEQKSSWAVLHNFFGSRDNAYFADLYRRRLISYLDWMKIDIALMIHSYGRPISKSDVEKALQQIKMKQNAVDAAKELKSEDFTVGVVSSGIDLLVKRICRSISSDICMYNELYFVNDELIPGGKPNVPLLEKVNIIKRIAENYGFSMDKVTYIGDSSWDITVFREVGLSIAVEPCGNACSEADYVVSDIREAIPIIKRYYSEYEML